MMFLYKISFTLLALGALTVLSACNKLLKLTPFLLVFLTEEAVQKASTLFDIQRKIAINRIKLSAFFFLVSLILQIVFIADLTNYFLK